MLALLGSQTEMPKSTIIEIIIIYNIAGLMKQPHLSVPNMISYDFSHMTPIKQKDSNI